MYRGRSIGVVLPAYNEEEFVGDVIQKIPDFVDRIYVVDDASTDDTVKEIISAARETEAKGGSEALRDGAVTELVPIKNEKAIPELRERAVVRGRIGRVILIEHQTNRGAGGAIKTGYLAARADEVDITATIDSDGQMDPELLPQFLDPIIDEGVDYTKGNRLLRQQYRQQMPPFRLFGNAVLTFLTKIASGYWKMGDPQNGYTAISREALANVGIENLYEGYGYCSDLLIMLNAKGMRIADVGMPAKYGDEQSHINYTSYIRNVSGLLLRDFFWRLIVRYFVLDFHPLGIFYVFGAVMVIIGVASGVWSVGMSPGSGTDLFVRLALSLILFTIGSMFVMFAMLFDMQLNEDREVKDY